MIIKNLVSVIIPVYNGDRWIARCLNSVLKQNYNSYEIIIVNDGSTDNSSNICNEFVEKYDNIIKIDIVNSGPGKARNVGLQSSKGEFIQFLDCDDSLVFNCLDLCVREYQNNLDINLLIFGFNIFRNGTLLRKPNPSNHSICTTRSSYDQFLQIDWLFPSPCNKLYKREYIKSPFPEHMVFGEDTAFNYLNISPNIKIKTISTSLYNVNLDNEFSFNKQFKKGKLFSIIYGFKCKITSLGEIFGNDIVSECVSIEFFRKLIYFMEVCSRDSSFLFFKSEIEPLCPYLDDIRLTNKAENIESIFLLILLKQKFYCVLFFYLKTKSILRQLYKKNINVFRKSC